MYFQGTSQKNNPKQTQANGKSSWQDGMQQEQSSTAIVGPQPFSFPALLEQLPAFLALVSTAPHLCDLIKNTTSAFMPFSSGADTTLLWSLLCTLSSPLLAER